MKVLMFLCAFWQVCHSATIQEVLQSLGNFKTILALEGKAGLNETIAGPGPYTVFVPTDEAFAKVPKQALEHVEEDPTLLKEVLLYHTVVGSYKTGDLANDQTLQTQEGHSLRFNSYNNGAVNTINGRVISKADVEADNGVIHVVDDPIDVWPEKTITDKVASEQGLSTISYMLNLTNLAATLQEEGPYTFFAPINRAFEKLDPEVMKNLLSDQAQLTTVVKRHIIKGTVFYAGLPSESLISIDGNDYTERFPNETKIVESDDIATNGVIQGVETLLL